MLTLLGLAAVFGTVLADDVCDWAVDGYYSGGGVNQTGDERIPLDVCLTPEYDASDETTWRSWMWTVEDHADGNFTMTRWTWNASNCDNDGYKWVDCLDSDDEPWVNTPCYSTKHFNTGSADDAGGYWRANWTLEEFYEPEDRDMDGAIYWNLGGTDCHVRVHEWFPEQFDRERDPSNKCYGINKSKANFTQEIYLMNENCTYSSIVRCNEDATRVTVKAEPYPGCDAEPWATSEQWYNYEGGCFDFSCGVNRTADDDFDFEDPPKESDSGYITIWDLGDTYAMGQCGNAYQSSSGVADELLFYTYSYKFEGARDGSGVYLHYYAYPNCRGTEYFGNFYTEDIADYKRATTSDSSFATVTGYTTGSGCGTDVSEFGPREYADRLYVTRRCLRSDEDADDAWSYYMYCSGDTLKQWVWKTAWCNGTTVFYQEMRTGCSPGGSYQEITCGDTNTLTFSWSASGRAVISWTAAAVVASGLVWFSL